MTGTSLVEITPERWGMLQRMAGAFSQSDLVPETLKGSVANCTVAMLLAEQMGESPIMVMQNIFFVHGRAGWITQYMVSRANTSGKFKGPLRWRTSEERGANLAVTCYADLREIEQDPRVEVTVDLQTAIDSGWTTFNDRSTGKPKTHPRWATPAMQEQMLRWRSAAWLIRLYAPEVMLGLPTAEEILDGSDAEMKDITPPKPTIDDFKPGGATNSAGAPPAADDDGRGDADDSSAGPPAEPEGEGLLERAHVEAAKGTDALRFFLQRLSPAERRELRPMVGTQKEPGALLGAAIHADNDRDKTASVPAGEDDMPTPSPAPAATNVQMENNKVHYTEDAFGLPPLKEPRGEGPPRDEAGKYTLPGKSAGEKVYHLGIFLRQSRDEYDINGVELDNAEQFEQMPKAYREDAARMIEARRKELAP